MALQMSYTAPDGTVYPECYISLVFVNANLEVAQVCVNFFANRAAFAAGELPLKLETTQTEIGNLHGDVVPAAYAYLLTLPEYASAIEVP